MKKNDKKLSKKTVDLEGEFVGIPVGPVGNLINWCWKGIF